MITGFIIIYIHPYILYNVSMRDSRFFSQICVADVSVHNHYV